MTILTATNISISFGGVKAIDGVSLAAEPGQILSIIGPNGAGKTTLFNVVSGVYTSDQGRVELAGEDVTVELDADPCLAGREVQPTRDRARRGGGIEGTAEPDRSGRVAEPDLPGRGQRLREAREPGRQ